MTNQMNDCLQRVQRKRKELSKEWDDLESKKKTLELHNQSITKKPEDSASDSWKKAREISDNSKKWHRLNRTQKLIGVKMELLKEILSGTMCWEV